MGIKKICANLLNQRYQCSYHCKWAAKKSVQICSISVISVPIIVNGHQINHPKLLAENRTRIKILLIDANEDMPIEIINDVLNVAIALV